MTLIGFGPLTKLSGEIGNHSIVTDNIHHIVTIDHLSNVNLALMTIQRGYDDRAFVAGQTQGFGAGVLALFSTVKLDGVILRDNLAYAGALSGKGTDVIVKNSLFENNTALNTGGAINVDDNDELNPGVGSLSVSNSAFKNNKSPGAGFGEGGAIVVWRLTANIKNSYFSNNSTNNTIFALGGAVSLDNEDHANIAATIEGNVFIDNSSTIAGALAINNYDASINHNKFYGNQASSYLGLFGGGAISVAFGAHIIDMDGNVFDSNIATPPQAGMHIQCLFGATISDPDGITDNIFLNPDAATNGVVGC